MFSHIFNHSLSEGYNVHQDLCSVTLTRKKIADETDFHHEEQSEELCNGFFFHYLTSRISHRTGVQVRLMEVRKVVRWII